VKYDVLLIVTIDSLVRNVILTFDDVTTLLCL